MTYTHVRIVSVFFLHEHVGMAPSSESRASGLLVSPTFLSGPSEPRVPTPRTYSYLATLAFERPYIFRIGPCFS